MWKTISPTPKIYCYIYWRIVYKCCVLSNQETSTYPSKNRELKVWLNNLLQFYGLWKSTYLWIRQRWYIRFNGFDRACWSADLQYNITTFTWWNWYFLIFFYKANTKQTMHWNDKKHRPFKFSIFKISTATAASLHNINQPPPSPPAEKKVINMINSSAVLSSN